MAGGEFKTRSSLFLAQMNDDVKAVLEEKAADMGLAKWVIVEKILEIHLGIDTSEAVNLEKWLGINNSRARLGKPAPNQGKKTR